MRPVLGNFIDRGDKIWGGPPGSPEQDGDRFLEFWNLVFMQFEQFADGRRESLPKPSIDTGMGLERMACVLQGVNSVFETDLFRALIAASEELTETKAEGARAPSHNVIADHLRSSCFLIADGVSPSNEGRGYVLRRIMRRAMRHAHILGAKEPLMHRLAPALIAEMGDAYPELKRAQPVITAQLHEEEERFRRTLGNGLKLLEDELATLEKGRKLPGAMAFKLYDTFGFPLDLTQDILRGRGLEVDTDGFDAAMEKQREKGRESWTGADGGDDPAIWLSILERTRGNEFLGYGAEEGSGKVAAIITAGAEAHELREGQAGALVFDRTPFYAESGGQAGDRGLIRFSNGAVFEVEDTHKHAGALHAHVGRLTKGAIKVGDKAALEIDHARRAQIRANHSATHLLHAALRNVLGPHVTQKGSLVEADYFRFDFSHGQALSAEEIAKVEDQVNAVIRQNAESVIKEMAPAKAIEEGALALFGEKYGDSVRVLRLGDGLDAAGKAYSVELCGGTHVRRTGDMSVRAELVLQNPRDPADPNGTRELPGLYRFDPVLGTMDVVVDEQWLLTHGGVDAVVAFAVVGEGRWLAFATRNAPGVLELWRASMQSRSAPVSLGVFSENHMPTLFDAQRNQVLIWVEANGGANVKATLVELGSGSQVELATSGVEGSLLDIGDEWLVVGRRAMEDLTEPVPSPMQIYDYFGELHIVPRDASVARTVFGPGESGYVAVRSETGALVHQMASGRERLEWRPFAAESARVLADREAASVCHFSWAADAHRQNVAAMDHAGRVLHVIDMVNGSARQFPAPASRRIGDYVPEHVTEVGDEESRDFEEQRLPLVRVEPWGEDACIEGMPLSFPTQRDEPRHLWISPDHVLAGASEQIIVPNGLRMGGVTDFMHVALADGEVTVLDDVSGVTPITWPLADAADIAEYGGTDVNDFARSLDWRFAIGSYYKNRLWGYPTGVLLDDGSGVAVGGTLHADAHIALGTDPQPITDADRHWARAQRFVVRDLDGDSSARSSLLNNVALLRVRSRDGGLLLSGVAMDRNLETYEVEWSRADLGPQWHPLGGVVSEPAKGELMFWVPPEPGDYRLRLTVRDRAGNVASDEARAIVLQGADIDDISLTPTHVSPNGDGVKDVVDVAFNVLRATELDFDVRDLDGNLVYRVSSTHVAPGQVTATWDGRDQSGVRVPDGTYTVSLGRWFSRQVQVDTTLPVLSLLRGNAARGTDGVDSPASELFGLSDRVVRNVNVSVDDRHLDAWHLAHALVSGPPLAIAAGQDVALDRPFDHDANTPAGLMLTASDLAGNVASVSMPGTRPELRTVARDVVDAPVPLGERAWGCAGTGNTCIYDRDGAFAPEPLSRDYAPGRFVLLDVWVQSHLQTHSPRVMQQGADGAWQNLPLVSAEQTQQGWRLVIAPVIEPEVAVFTLQAFVDTAEAEQLRSELLEFENPDNRITALNLVANGVPDVCADAELIAAAGPLGADQALVCARENFEGIDYAPHLAVQKSGGVVASGQLVLVRDGVWLFRIDGECRKPEI